MVSGIVVSYSIDLIKGLSSRLVLEWDETRRWKKKYIANSSQPNVFYGTNQVLGPENKVSGGLVKLQDLVTAFPNCLQHPNLLYLVSSRFPSHALRMVDIALSNGAGFVLNQNGVAFPAWCAEGWRQVNERLARILHSAHHVFYQSEFCRVAADEFLGKSTQPSEVLYNPVDTSVFVPLKQKKQSDELRLLLAGSHNVAYRVRTAIQALSQLRRQGVECRLLIAGKYGWANSTQQALREAHEIAAREQVVDWVDFQGAYRQEEAPTLFQSADILLHTQYNDASPRLVVEAMACGLPVVYSASGGVPELVGSVGGIGVPTPLDWEHAHPPNPDGIADAVIKVSEKLNEFSRSARNIAITKFDVFPWIERHRELFNSLCC